MIKRPLGVTALSLFFLAGAAITATAALALLNPGSPLEPIWKLNPHVHEGFLAFGGWAIALLAIVSPACLCAGIGFWHGHRWGYRLGVGLLIVNLISDVVNFVTGVEPRAAIGVPIVAVLLVYLFSAEVGRFFARPKTL